MNLIWFRTDLRLADNPALFQALKNSREIMALFIIHKKQHEKHGESPHKLEFIKAHVNDVVNRLNQLGVKTLVEEIPSFKDVGKLFEKLINSYGIDEVFINVNYWINEVNRDNTVKQILKENDINVREYHTNYLLPPGSIRKGDGSMYHVFTPYKNKFIERLKANYQLPLPIPNKVEHSRKKSECAQLTFEFEHRLWPIGEKLLSERIKQFMNTANYQSDRDYPAINGTSMLSPYLAIGVLSAQQCLAHALKQNGEDAFYSTWVSELIWRDFYNDLMYEYPHLAKHETFKPQAVDDWLENDELFQYWKQGNTGFPIVDAGMRQLLVEGWMHNRVRMIVASFLCKLCLIDWRKGEAHFMAHLLDGDLASNNGGWQWSSATGCDAAPYFRIFNPTTQSKKFDPDGVYIKKYVKELAGLETSEIHDPKPETRKKHHYSDPVIDYKTARSRALDWFKR